MASFNSTYQHFGASIWDLWYKVELNSDFLIFYYVLVQSRIKRGENLVLDGMGRDTVGRGAPHIFAQFSNSKSPTMCPSHKLINV